MFNYPGLSETIFLRIMRCRLLSTSLLTQLLTHTSSSPRMASSTDSTIDIPEPTSSIEPEPQSKPFRKSREHPEIETHRKKKSKMIDKQETCHYHIENCLKFVQPYYYNATAFAKGRWFGRSIIDISSSEFTSHPREYYAKAIVNGRLKLNDRKITNFDTIIKNGDKISHLMHRHEPPILSKAIEILYKGNDLLVLNKPSSIPVHPSGRYHFNTLIHLLRLEHGFSDLFTIHRLDRLTSGIILVGLSSKASRRVSKLIQRREVTKEYVCIVQGKFHDEIYVNKPIECVSHQIGVCKVSSDDNDEGKLSETSFECLAYDGDRSLVKCMPKTGRMHQIRVHLQYLGFPIINDPIYNHPAWELPKYNSKIPKEKVEEMIKLLKGEIAIQEDVHAPKAEVSEEESSIPTDKAPTTIIEPAKVIPTPKSQHAEDHIMKHPLKYGDLNLSQTELHAIYAKLNPDPDPICDDCKSLKNIPQMCLYLHAMTYKSCDWEFRTKLPDWAESFEFETKSDYKDFVSIAKKD